MCHFPTFFLLKEYFLREGPILCVYFCSCFFLGRVFLKTFGSKSQKFVNELERLFTLIIYLFWFRYQTTPQYRGDRVVEALGKVYKCHYPTEQNKTGRNVKKSPIHDRLAAKGAFFKEVSGYESPDWFAPAGVTFLYRQ
jgi:hypothetical protein